MSAHNELGETLNDLGEVATHQDCGENWRGGCSGWMCYWENPNTGNTRLLCADHADEAERRQNQIHRDFLNDSVPMEDY